MHKPEVTSDPEIHWALQSFKTRLLVYLFFFSLVSSILFLRSYRVALSDQEWDVLIFTQRWPNTVCMDWEEKSPTNHTCRLPTHKDIWTIHGIWPTKFGTLGPTFCNSSMSFNASQLAPIMNNLTEYWIDVEVPNPTNSFWRHEWRKHGTCSAVLVPLSTELKYFEQGLKWLTAYNMRDVLSKGRVMPDNNVGQDLSSIWLAVKTGLGINPSLHCVHDKKTGHDYLQEIRICFDKQLALVDCDGVRVREQFQWAPLGNCPNDKPIFYPASVPPTDRKPVTPPPDSPVASLLKTIQFVMWFSS